MILYNPTVSGSLLVTGSLTTTGTITSQTLVVQTITSSIEFNTGSTRNGTLLTNTHEFTGSVSITGSAAALLNVNNGVLFVSSSGNVGIGSTSPAFKLETLGTSVIVAGFGRSDYGATNVTLVGLSGYRDVYKSAIGVVRTGDYDVGDMIFCLNSAANSTVVSASDEKMRIKSSGNVGIGTTSPNSFGGGYRTLAVAGTGTEGGMIQSMVGSTSALYIGTNSSQCFFAEPRNVFMTFGTNDTERMRITSEGYLGTTVTGTTVTDGDLLGLLSFVSKDASTYSSGGITNIRSYATSTYNTGNVAGDLRFYVSNGLQNTTGTYLFGTEAMRITSGGSVFIGCTSDPNASTNGIGLYPNGEIDVSRSDGTSGIFNRNTSNGQILDFRFNNTQVGSISTNSNSLPSDFNFKKDIIDISIGLNLVNKLRPVHYRHKMDEDDEALSNGIIAQELEQALLECGIEKNSLLMLQHKPNEKQNESQYWVDYTKMIPILTKAIQELSAKNTALEEILQRNNIQ